VETQPVVLISGEIDEKHGAIAEVVDDCLDAAIVEQIRRGEASAGVRFDEAGPEMPLMSLNLPLPTL